MMRKKVATVAIIALLLFMLAVPLSALIRQKPTLAASIKTWSMEPLLTRGDLVFLWPSGKNTGYSVGQIVVFRSEEHGIREWTMHRIVGGDAQNGYITRGDANQHYDQEMSNFPPVNPAWIVGVVPTVGSLPLKIPLLGYISLYFENQLSYQSLIPALIGILAVVLVFDEIVKNKKRRRKESLNQGQLYLLGGLAVAVLMGSLMIAGSLFITFPYGVEDSPGVLMGSDVGILEQGSFRTIELADIKNSGIVPSYYVAVSSDHQVVLDETGFRLGHGGSAAVTATVYAREPGLHQARVVVGMFLPFLPSGVIGYLSQVNYWLALAAVAFVPAMPVFIIPFLEPRYRRRFARAWRRRLLRFAARLSFPGK